MRRNRRQLRRQSSLTPSQRVYRSLDSSRLAKFDWRLGRSESPVPYIDPSLRNWTLSQATFDSDGNPDPQSGNRSFIVREDTATALHQVYYTGTNLRNGSTDFYFWTYYESGYRTHIQALVDSGVYVTIDLTDNSFVDTNTTTTLLETVNGWTRWKVTGDVTGGAASFAFLGHNGSTNNYLGDGRIMAHVYDVYIEQRDNLVDDDDMTTWTNGGLSAVNDNITDPFGGTDAYELVENTATSTHYVQAAVTGYEDGIAYVDLWVRYTSGYRQQISIVIDSGQAATIDISTQAQVGGSALATLLNTSGEWQRWRVRGDVAGTPTFQIFGYLGGFNYLGDGRTICQVYNYSARQVHLGTWADQGPGVDAGLVDGDMEDSGTSAWTVLGDTVPSKVTSDPYKGTRSLRLTLGPTANNDGVYQTILTVGTTYRITGVTRSDGNIVPRIGDRNTPDVWTGTLSTSWQKFDFTFIPTQVDFRLGCDDDNTGVSGEYCEFDDITITEVYDLSQSTTSLRPWSRDGSVAMTADVINNAISPLKGGETECSFAANVKTDGSAGAQVFVENRRTGGGAYALALVAVSATAFYVYINSSANWVSYNRDNDNEMHHYVVAFSSGSLTTYYDGDLLTPIGSSGSIPGSIGTTQGWAIGALYTGANSIADGEISSVEVFDKELNANEAKALFREMYRP